MRSLAACFAFACATSWFGSAAALAEPTTPADPVALRNGSKCLDVHARQREIDGARVELAACSGLASQRWRFADRRVVNAETDRCLEVHAPDVGTNGARVQVARCHGGPLQEWEMDRGQLVAGADGRCLDVHGADLETDGARVQTWKCRGGPRQTWTLERAGLAPAARDVEAGPIWSNADADRKCPATCAPGRWTGAWRTTVEGRVSVCNCAPAEAPEPAPRGAGSHGPQPMTDARFAALLAAMEAELGSDARLRVLEDAARGNHFLVAQTRRLIDGFPFPSDKLRAVEIAAPRVVDPENAFELTGAFGFESEKERVRALFAPRD